MALSPNYSWSEPDNSSLVKNGAADIRTLGDAIDTSVWNVGYGQAGKNKIINGDFGIWQRGTSFNPAATGFFMFADRFRSYTYSASATTATQQAFTAGTAPVAGYEGTYFGRVVSTNSFAYFSYNGIENVRTFAGQPVTLSYYAKSASAQTLSEVAVVQYFGGGGSASVNALLTTQAITTSWTRYSHTFTMPSISGKTITTNDSVTINIKGAINNALDMWGFQLEYGSKATPFQTASGGSPQAELAMCQRYYYRTGGDSTVNPITLGIISGTTNAQGYISTPVSMRVPPTSVEFSTLKVSGGAMPATAVTSVTLNQVGKTFVDLTIVCTGATFTNGAACIVQGNGSTSNYLGLSAEF
jgi:hypothetical protein